MDAAETPKKILVVLVDRSMQPAAAGERTPGVSIALISKSDFGAIDPKTLPSYDAVIVAATTWEDAHRIAGQIDHAHVHLTKVSPSTKVTYAEVQHAATEAHDAKRRAEATWGIVFAAAS